MSTLTVAVVQQMSRVYEDSEAYQADVRRFMRQVKSKHADVVVFPELSGLMLAYPLISGVKRGLLRRADRGAARRASPLSKALGVVAGTTVDALGSGMRGSLTRLLRKRHGELFDLYVSFFSEVAAEYGMYVVGGSVYLYDEDMDEVRNTSYLFDPRGQVVGYQEKLVPNRQDQELASPGDRVQVFSTEVGRLGMVIGSDVLYPEPARALAVQGAELLLAPAACPGPVMYRRVRDAFQARVEENQLFGAISFLVGPNNLGPDPFAGKSAVLAPLELTPRYVGVLQEVGANNVEGFVVLECDLAALARLQETSDPPLRDALPLACGSLLADFYRSGSPVSVGVQISEAEAVEIPDLPVQPDLAQEEGSPVIENQVAPAAEVSDGWPFESGS